MDTSQLSEMNVLPAQKQNKRCYDAQAILELVVRPRTVKRLGPREAVKEAWLFSKSMFKPYRYDTVELLERCFEFDYEQIKGKVEYLVKDEADRKMVKKYLKQDYKLLRDAYKLTAGEDSSGTGMSIGKNAFMLLL